MTLQSDIAMETRPREAQENLKPEASFRNDESGADSVRYEAKNGWPLDCKLGKESINALDLPPQPDDSGGVVEGQPQRDADGMEFDRRSSGAEGGVSTPECRRAFE